MLWRVFAPAKVPARFMRFPFWMSLRPSQLKAAARETAHYTVRATDAWGPSGHAGILVYRVTTSSRILPKRARASALNATIPRRVVNRAIRVR